jgi:NADPH:quinone reductase-like Zn-dependent oxidoreductase
MVSALEATELQPVLDSVYGFGQLQAAMDHLTSGKHFGKIGIDFAR